MKDFIKPIYRFIHREVNSGIVLIFATIAALIVANSPLAEKYFEFFEHTTIDFKFQLWSLSKPLHYWINDGLMGLFFFLIGLEVKREIKIGELSTLQKALLPTVAAVGGMVVPAAIFFFLNKSDSTYVNGWAIPMATDIAFALGVISLLGKRVPLELKIFLTSLAVVDDIGAVLTIAVFYTADISVIYLIIALVVWLALFLINKLGVRSLWIYVVIGIFGVWYPLLLSGVHATIAGVLVAFTIPMSRKYNTDRFVENVKLKISQFVENKGNKKTLLTPEQYDSVDDIKMYCDKVSSPLQNLEHALHNVTFYFIMPLFAFANTGIRFADFDFKVLMENNLPLGIFLGLVVGKVTGILLFVFIFHKLKIIKIPKSFNLAKIIGAGFLAGIGFTMSIFITELAFHNDELITVSKVSILFASLTAGILGFLILRFGKKNNNNIE